MPVRRSLADALDRARPRAFALVPILIGAGVAGWFALPDDPGRAGLWAALGLAALSALLALRWRMLGLGMMCLALGFAAAALRAERVAAPVLPFRYYGMIEGRVVAVDRSYSDRMRLTLDRVMLEDVPAARTPARVRLSLHGAAEGIARPAPGTLIRAKGHLVPPEGPVEPGAFDFRRWAWFRGLGAFGYVRDPPQVLAPPAAHEARIDRLRHKVAQAVRAAIPGDPGGFTAAILTGDRSGLGQAATEDLRAANLSHLLAISGLHMGLLTGFVFALIRTGLALIPPLALRLQAKKIAAAVALVAGGVYLALSGGNVATERAYVMVAVFLGAVLLDRRALSLRSVALAAVVILLIAPESLVEPGFQMSFAATLALVVAFAALRDSGLMRGRPGWQRAVVALVVSSAVAGAATAPIAALHFNRVSDYGLIANLVTVPLMGTLIMPAAVVAGLLAPFGAAAPALWVMQQGSAWILTVAGWIARLEGAVRAVPMAGAHVAALLGLGGLWLLVWPGRARWAGAAVLAMAVLTWQGGARPALLISPDGGLMGLQGPAGRALSAPRGEGFVAQAWLEHDAEAPGVDQAGAAARPGFAGEKGVQAAALGDWRLVHLKGKAGLAALGRACAEADLVVINARIWPDVPQGCIVIDQTLLAHTGAIAARLGPDGALHLRAAQIGNRPWNRPGGRSPHPAAPWPSAWERAGQATAILRLPTPTHLPAATRLAARDQ